MLNSLSKIAVRAKKIIKSIKGIVLGGNFTVTEPNVIFSPSAIRLNTGGSSDTGFTVGTGFNSTVWSIAVQSDGKILVGGEFTAYNGTGINRIARLNSDGSLDTGFSVGTGFNSTVRSIAVQSDGKILVGGQFTVYNGTGRNRIARLNSDGSLESNFDFKVTDNEVYSIASTGV